MGYVISIDVGGTHTDIVCSDGHGIKVLKVPSIPGRDTEAVLNGLGLAAQTYGVSVEELLVNCERLTYGSTIATNMFLQHKVHKAGLLATKGHRDALYFGDLYKSDVWNMHVPPPWEIVPRCLRLGIEERVNYKGVVLTPLNEGEVRDAARRFRDEKVEAVAICFLWSFLNPAHEQRAREIIKEELPGIPVIISYDVLPVMREWERTFCTALSAAVMPGLELHLTEFQQECIKTGLKRKPLIAQSSGGVATVEAILRKPLNSILSGPAGGAAAGVFYSERSGSKDILTIDMGGTSFDVCFLEDSKIPITKTKKIEEQPFAIPCVDIHTIGAGGGSIAWIDTGGALQVGPESAGAVPGPACYGRGGQEPTVTDAFLLLGYIDPNFFLGGRIRLHPELAEKAVSEKIARRLGMNPHEIAWPIIDLVNHRMANAMRVVSLWRGIDVASCALVVGGGAGPLVAGKLAEEVGIKRIFVPREPGGLCALGTLTSNLKHEAVGVYAFDADKADAESLTKLYEDLERANEELLLAEGIPKEKIKHERLIDARYVSQLYELETPVPRLPKYEPKDIPQIASLFEEMHDKLYHYKLPGALIQFVSCRVESAGEVGKIKLEEMPFAGANAGPALKSKRSIYSPEKGGFVEVPVYDCVKLRYGNVIDGLAVVESEGSTLIVWENQRLTVDNYGDFILDVPLHS